MSGCSGTLRQTKNVSDNERNKSNRVKIVKKEVQLTRKKGTGEVRR